MTISHCEPERRALWVEKKLVMDEHWRRGRITDATYTASLMCIGYGEVDARHELSILEMERRQWNETTRR